ncbi:MAG: hypothetical protein QMD13_09920 [Candidatus Bathyarchaeia archaeon]|nr:hypothetical protein [Candidatus Bathyarchaeia archaeon]
MKYEVNEAITTYMESHKCERDVAIKEITQKYGRTLAKMVDEYNWVKIRMRCVNCRHVRFISIESKYYCDLKKTFISPKNICKKWNENINRRYALI